MRQKNKKIFYTLKEISESEHYDLNLQDLIIYACNDKLQLVAYININKVKFKPYLLLDEYSFEPKSGLYYIDKTCLYELSLTNSVDSIVINSITQEQFTYDTYNYFIDKVDIENSLSEIYCYENNEELFNPYRQEDNNFEFEFPYVIKLDDIGVLYYDLNLKLLDDIITYDTQEITLISTVESATINPERKIYMLIIKSLLNIILGKYPGLVKHPALKKGQGIASDLKYKLLELEERGLGQRNLEQIFSAANSGKDCRISDETLLIAIAALMEIILGNTAINGMKGKLHPFVDGQTDKDKYQDVLFKLAKLEKGLRETDLQTIFKKAEDAKKTP